MSENLIEHITSFLTPDVINKAGTYLRESPASTSKAMSSIIPTMLASISNMAGSPGGATHLAGLLSSGGHDGSILNNVGNLFGGGSATSSAIQQGQGLLSTLFGNKVDATASTVSGFSGMGKSSATSLMALAAPLVMGVLGKLRSTEGLNPDGMANLLSGQKSAFLAAVPAGLTHLTSSYDVQGLQSVTVAPIAEATGFKWWPLLLLLPLVLGLLWFVGRGKPTPSAVAALEQVKLCSGESVSLMNGTFNYNLARYLATGTDADLPKTFVFDNLNFDSASTELTPPSRQTVNDLIVILKGCPNAQVQLVGHTDNTGDAAANQTLSVNRANAIQALLAADGVAPERMTIMGFGQDKPIASNDTDEGKSRNRRTELVVIKR